MWPFGGGKGEEKKKPEFPSLGDREMAESGHIIKVRRPQWHMNLGGKYEVIARISVEREDLKEPLYQSAIPVPISGYRSNLQRRMGFGEEDYGTFVLVFKPLLEEYETLAEKVNREFHP